MFDRLAAAGVKHGDVKGFLFGAIDALDARGRPSLTDMAASERADERDTGLQRRLERTRAETAELRAVLEKAKPVPRRPKGLPTATREILDHWAAEAKMKADA